MATSGASHAGSGGSSRSSFVGKRERSPTDPDQEHSDNLLDRRSSLEYGIFGVLFTLSKEKSEHRIRIRWVLLKILLDGWQLFTTVINPQRQAWNINAEGTPWKVIGVLNFYWLGDLGYGAYLAVLYAMMALLAINVAMCVWVAWCFKEHKFPVVWPIKVLRVFSSVFFQAFDVASLNLLQLGISCRYTGPGGPKLHFELFPQYSCTAPPHITHAVVSALCLILFVALALLLNMAEVEVNPLSRRPMALGHSGAEVTAFAIKVVLTLVNVFTGWLKVEASIYLSLSLALAWQTLRWSPHLVAWVNYLKAGVSAMVVWCSAVLMLLVFHPGIRRNDLDQMSDWSDAMTILLLAGTVPAFGVGALLSWAFLRRMDALAKKGLENPKKLMVMESFSSIDEPRDVEMAARCCRVWKEPGVLDPDAVNKAHQIIKAGLEMFPHDAFMVLLHANFMIDVLGVAQSGSRRIEDARKLNPALICRFIMFVRQQQATQNAAGSSMNSSAAMDLLGYVEYQRKQRMVVRLHREALQAMCNFWKALDASSVSFTHLSKALGKIESSVSQAQRAYRVVLESYGNNPKLVHLYGRFLQTIKNDPWHAAEYFAEAERLEEMQDTNASGPLMPDGTPLSRMDEIDTAVLVLSATGEVQMANRHTQFLFGYKRGTLEGKPLATLLAPHYTRHLADRVMAIAAAHQLLGSVELGEESEPADENVVVLHAERLAFPAKLSLRKATGVGEDSTIIALVEPVAPTPGVSSVWVTNNGIITACDPSFVANFGWKAGEVNGNSIKGLVTFALPAAANVSETGVDGCTLPPRRHSSLMTSGIGRVNESASEMIKRLLAQAAAAAAAEAQSAAAVGAAGDLGLVMGFVPGGGSGGGGMACLVPHKYMRKAIPCSITIVPSAATDSPIVHELRIKADADPVQLLAVNRKGAILHASAELAARLKDRCAARLGGLMDSGFGSTLHPTHPGGHVAVHNDDGVMAGETASAYTAPLHGYSLFDFMSPAWKQMHFKLLKEITTVSPLPVTEMSCRKVAQDGPTLELRTASGREIYMRVGVSTTEVQGETVHIVNIARSSLEEALAERRVRLRVSPDGLIAAVEAGKCPQLFGLEPAKVVGRGVWEIVEEPTPSGVPARTSNTSAIGRNPATLISRALKYPGYSWRVQVVPPPSRVARTSFTPVAKPAVMQLQALMPTDDDETGAPSVLVDLWPVTSVVGVLELDPYGRVRALLEEKTRPAGLLFGVPGQSLVGTALGELVVLPPGRMKPGDLLSMHGSKKSSLKAQSQAKEANVKVGPVHKLRGTHVDGRPLTLDLQAIGKPGTNDPVTVIVRVHQTPLMPLMLAAPPMAPAPAPPAAAAAVAAALPSQVPALPALKPAVAAAPPQPQVMLLQVPLPAPPPPPPLVARMQTPPITPFAGQGAPDGAASAAAMTAPARLSSTRIANAEVMVLDSLFDGRAVEAAKLAKAPTAPAPQRTPSLDDASPRPSSPWCEPSGSGRGSRGAVVRPPQSPLAGRTLSTPQAARTFGGVSDGLVAVTEYDAAGPPSLTHGLRDLEDMDEDDEYDNAPPLGDLSRAVITSRVASPAVKSPSEVARSKLADMVRSVGSGGGGGADRGTSSRPLAAPPVRGSGGGFGGGGDAVVSLGGGGGRASAESRAMTPPRKSRVPGSPKISSAVRPGRTDGLSEYDGAASDSDDHSVGRDKDAASRGQTAGRVMNWVASKGAYYQNSSTEGPQGGGRFVPSRDRNRRRSQEDEDDGDGDGGGDASGGSLLVGASRSALAPGGEGFLASPLAGTRPPGRSALGPGTEGMTSGPEDEDAASDGGQSAMSGAQSATGSEYTRGKRFRKLAKIMDSSQAQHAQNRLRIHSLIVVGLLGILHTICFVLTVTAIQDQKTSMTQLSRSGQAQLFLHRIIINVRSLDVISHDKWLPNLFTPDDAEYFVERIASDAEELKIRFNEILNTHSTSADIMRLLYQTKRTVWDTNDFDGSDIFINVTIWDFSSRFYTMARQIKQQYNDIVRDGLFVADSYAGQFLLKSGPDLFSDSRKILDALLYNAVDNARRVDTLQIVFLLVEGAAISFIAACYLTYLLRAVAAQRFKLYGTFLVIPVGLTRALASQNLNLLIDEDEDDDGEDEDERAAQAVIHETEDGGNGGQQKLRRRATLKVESSEVPQVASPNVGGGGWNSRRPSEMRGPAASTGGGDESPPPDRKPPYMDSKYDKMRTLTSDSAISSMVEHAPVYIRGGGRGLCCGFLRWLPWSRRGGARKRRNSIFPLPMSMFMIGGSTQVNSSTTGKRSLRFDSKETFLMLLPFVIWSIMVITIYAIAVVKMQGVDEVVSVHSVVNFMAARTSRTVFFCQELANVDDPKDLLAKRAVLLRVVKLLKDAWYTLQLGDEAYTALGDATERFPLVKTGLSHASPKLEQLFYSSGICHRTGANLPCPGSEYRFYQVSHTGLDSMMQQVLISLSSMATNTSMIPEGLEDEHFDFVYNVGYKDLLDGVTNIAEAHFDTILALFNYILVLHIVLFLIFWVVFGSFVIFMLNPLLTRVARERRRIAELMSQLPLELDVERLVARALGSGNSNQQQQGAGGGDGDRSEHGGASEPDATSKWKAIIRASSSLTGKVPSMDIRKRP